MKRLTLVSVSLTKRKPKRIFVLTKKKKKMAKSKNSIQSLQLLLHLTPFQLTKCVIGTLSLSDSRETCTGVSDDNSQGV